MNLVRLCKNSDLKLLAEIYTNAYLKANVGEKWTYKASLKLLKYYFKQQPDLFFVIEENKKLVGGIVGIIKPWWDGNHIFDSEFFIHPQFQKKGLGKILLRHFLSDCINKYKVITIDWVTFNNKKHPLNWYRKIGFKSITDWVLLTGDTQQLLKSLNE